MSITAAITNSFKADLFAGVHDADDVYKLALYTDAATLNKSTAAYTATGEIVDAGYTAGGIILTGYSAGSGSDVAWIDWADPVWNDVSFSADGALIYNSSKSNKSVAVIDFGETVVSTNGPFTVKFPVAAAGTAAVRIA